MRHLLFTGAALLLLAVQFLFGGVHVDRLRLIQIGLFSLAALAMILSPPRLRPATFTLPWLLLLSLLLIQIVPLPAMLAELLSPGAYQAALEACSVSGLDCGWTRLSLNPFGTKTALLDILSGLAFLSILARAFRSGTSPLAGVWLLLVMGLFQVAYGAVQTFGAEQKIWWWTQEFKQYKGYLTGTYINKNHLAGFIGLAAPMCFGAALAKFKTRDRPIAIVFAFGGLIMLAGLPLTGSRGGVVSLALATAVVCILMQIKKNSRLSMPIQAAILVLCACAAWFGLKLSSRSALEEFFRPELWQAVLPMLKDFPLTGVGLGAFSQGAYPYLPPSMSGATPPIHAHNDWLQLALETGLPGLALFLAGAWLFMRRFLDHWSRSEDPTATGLGLGMIWALTYMAAHSLFDFNLRIPANGFALLLVLAIGSSALGEKTANPAESRPARIFAGVVAACLLLASIQPVVAEYRAHRLCPTGIDSTAGPSPEPTPPKIAKAVSLTPLDARLQARMAEHYMRAGDKSSPPNPALKELAALWLAKALKNEPANGWYWYHLGTMLQDTASADQCMTLARKYRPRDARLLYALGEYWVLRAFEAENRADRENARLKFTAILRQAVKWDRGDWKTGNWRRAAIAIWKCFPNPALVRQVVPPTDAKARRYFESWLKLRPAYGGHY